MLCIARCIIHCKLLAFYSTNTRIQYTSTKPPKEHDYIIFKNYYYIINNVEYINISMYILSENEL